MTDQATQEAHAFLKAHPDTRFVDTFMMSISGHALGKRESIKDLERIFRSGVTFSACAALLDVRGHGHDAGKLGGTDGDPDAVGFPLSGSLVPVPWATAPTAQCVLSMRDVKIQEELWFDPRKILADVVKALHADGYRPVVACELEFYMIDSERTPEGGIKPAKLVRTKAAPRVAQNLGLEAVEDYAPFVNAIERAAALQNIPATTAVAEYGLGQFEINLQHSDDPVKAADDAVLLRRLIRGVARSQGHDATFMAKPYLEEPGNGLHIHVSLVDEKGKNLFGAAGGDVLLGHAVAGLQKTLSESFAFFAPNFSAFRRFEQYNFVPVNAHWGPNNRSVALRIPHSNEQGRRIEHRASCADASPHLAMAAVLAGLHHGIRNRLQPSEPIIASRADTIAPPRGFKTPASHLHAALDDLVKAKRITDTIPLRFLKAYRDTKRGELNELFERPTPREYDFYL